MSKVQAELDETKIILVRRESGREGRRAPLPGLRGPQSHTRSVPPHPVSGTGCTRDRAGSQPGHFPSPPPGRSPAGTVAQWLCPTSPRAPRLSQRAGASPWALGAACTELSETPRSHLRSLGLQLLLPSARRAVALLLKVLRSSGVCRRVTVGSLTRLVVPVCLQAGPCAQAPRSVGATQGPFQTAPASAPPLRVSLPVWELVLVSVSLLMAPSPTPVPGSQ